MTQEQQDRLLRTSTTIYIQNVCRTFKDMANADFAIDTTTPIKTPFNFEDGLTVISHFSGMIQGDFMFSTDEITASKIADVYPQNASIAAVVAHRDTYSGLMCEAMNISAHHSLEVLEKNFGTLTLLPPAWIYGEYHTADYISGISLIRGKCGIILCSLCLNMVGLQLPEHSTHERQRQ
jgi:CheY-specific phosphatase CheX